MKCIKLGAACSPTPNVPRSNINIVTWAQLFEGRLALNPGLNLTRVSVSCVQKHFPGSFSLLFLELPFFNLQRKRIKTEMLFKLLNLDSNLALTLGYFNPALNNPAQMIRPAQRGGKVAINNKITVGIPIKNYVSKVRCKTRSKRQGLYQFRINSTVEPSLTATSPQRPHFWRTVHTQ